MSKQPAIPLIPNWRDLISEEDIIFGFQTRYDTFVLLYGSEEGFKEQYERLDDDWGQYKHYMELKYKREFPEIKHMKVEYVGRD